MIDTAKLRWWTERSDPSTITDILLENVISDLENGADLALRDGYEPTVSKNAKSAFETVLPRASW